MIKRKICLKIKTEKNKKFKNLKKFLTKIKIITLFIFIFLFIFISLFKKKKNKYNNIFKSKIIAITYANEKFERQAKCNKKSAFEIGNVDEHIMVFMVQMI